MPRCRVLTINLGCFGAESNNPVVVFVFDLESLLVGLKVLKLPRRQLLVALAEQLGVNLLRVGQHYLQLACGALTSVVLIVNVIRDCNLDLSHVVGKLTLLLLDNELGHALFLLFFKQHFLAFL